MTKLLENKSRFARAPFGCRQKERMGVLLGLRMWSGQEHTTFAKTVAVIAARLPVSVPLDGSSSVATRQPCCSSAYEGIRLLVPPTNCMCITGAMSSATDELATTGWRTST